MTHNKATLTGLIAIVLWSAIVGLIRAVSEGLGAVGGAAMIYSLSALLLLLTVGFPDIKKFPRAYLITGSLLFVCYELCLSLSLGFATTRTQAIEVGMVNYLWPAMTVVLSVLVTRQKCSLLLIPGLVISVAGIGRVLAGDSAFSLLEIGHNIASNPLSYGLAFSGAVIWSVYCVVTRQIARGSNGITLFFILTALALWLKFFAGPQPEMIFTVRVVVSLGLAAMAMGFGYAAWNTGILHGNVTILAAASYFIPVISAVLAAGLLNASLSVNFWQGAGMVSLGSLLCWWSTRTKTLRKASSQT
ncbi:aromatic amino acid DMT transporter YddG [Erwinia persicina]|uniref:Aromatic amino acid DMT transporter YddG n=1 Tax=Erwinia persicina TaxID=55211 RepID=A0A4U3F6I7_9GAMM|nr:aromatic amino acid DMT transporter YddG [Erwinia persicina]MBD8107228.1 aromatic amino acid DMT transporter YddG [Erwinia persicina]MBD8210308.1 aromatic amino acid DMT transporter YddG [Erwinia persicina]TKJ89083.1 EamA family transporter [Erwinia persicina]